MPIHRRDRSINQFFVDSGPQFSSLPFSWNPRGNCKNFGDFRAVSMSFCGISASNWLRIGFGALLRGMSASNCFWIFRGLSPSWNQIA